MISHIVICAKNHVIGSGGDMPWHIPEDLKFFKETTMGKPIIMGRKTYESIGRALPGRLNIVITRNPSFSAEGVLRVCSLEEAIATAKKGTEQISGDEIMIMGGGEIYKQSFDLVDRIYFTVIDQEFVGDTKYPEFDQKAWRETVIKTAREPFSISWKRLDRK